LDTLCQRYGCLPSQLLAEPAPRLVRMMQLLAAGAEPSGTDAAGGAVPGDGRPDMEQLLANASKAFG
jgi:hypothetical protein